MMIHLVGKIVRHRWGIIALLLSLNLAPLHAQTSSLHILNVRSSQDLHAFFKYTGQDIPLISGHRGGTTKGFPENCIATFENTLRYTPAFFEIDPRLTKDSVIVLMHDATLDRTTTGTGKVADYTWSELKKLKLKDAEGNVTSYGIPTLDEVIEWSKGKTIINLDRKDVPLAMTARKLREHQASATKKSWRIMKKRVFPGPTLWLMSDPRINLKTKKCTTYYTPGE